jgi:hypothetical protein
MPTGLLAGGSYDTNTTASALRDHSCSGPGRFFSSAHCHISDLYYYAKSALVPRIFTATGPDPFIIVDPD